MFLKPAQIVQRLKNKGYLLQGFQVGDFGCGAGYFTALFAQVVGPEGRVKAIDVQEEVLQEAKEFVSQAGYKNVDYILADLEEKTSLPDFSLDLVFISQVLFQVEKPEKILQEAYRVLKPNKYLVVIEPEKGHPLFQEQKTFLKEELEDLLVKTGFQIREVDLLDQFHLIVAQK